MGELNSWRGIRESIIWVTGFSTHPSHILDGDKIKDYFKKLVEKTGMEPVGEPRIEHVKKICLPNGRYCDGTHGFQLWKTSGVAVYAWEIGKLSVTIHTCKDVDADVAIKLTAEHFKLFDHDWNIFYSGDLLNSVKSKYETWYNEDDLFEDTV